ncbi:glycosyltransferase [Lactiplantibacillus sp. WILCCON 0030]|uniref:Glycosyltransferase n=1 Tax=Lactiplantibacillus brownii TaxID=3069269 RepID=A0ABU1AAS5_9LACO|nr:glycosyltransferase [Lactiplantibacillus brownii]MDQ7937740.1 glycosyltransferase [Lactiplantibacillus brownii]
MSELSISIVLYNNSAGQIDKVVKNLLNVTRSFTGVEIFLINNSRDNYYLNWFLKRYENSKQIHIVTADKNRGFGAGNNLVLNRLNSEYHIVMNPDVMISDALELKKMVHYMDENTEYGLLSPVVKFPDGKVQHLLKQKSNVLDMALRFTGFPGFSSRKEKFVSLPDGYASTHPAENVPGSFMLFRTKILKDIDGFDQNYFLYMEDCDITMKINQVSQTIFYSEAYVYHEWQRENKKSLRGIIRMLQSMVKYFNKWGWQLY